VVPADELLEQSLAWAQELAAKAPLALRYAKQVLNSAVEESLGNTISDEARLQHICVNSEDSQEGIAAFMEKRQPQWKGR
jgi:2-(1,2-epoxy-1,2-dihydrophenyl)acetyl-CoA isomerase